MKISEIFKENKREASSFITVPSNPVVPFTENACNCSKVFKGIQPPDPRDPESVRRYHAACKEKIDSLIFDPEARDNPAKRIANAEVLGSLKLTEPSAQPESDFANHLHMHVTGAGRSHRDYGILDSELGENFATSSSRADRTQRTVPVAPTIRNIIDCGPCHQYKTMLENHAKKYGEQLARTLAGSLPTGAPASENEPIVQATAGSIAARIYENWARRRKTPGAGNKIVDEGNQIVENWDNHLAESHNTRFSREDLRFTPVVPADMSVIDRVYRTLKGITPGWSTRRRRDLPLKDPLRFIDTTATEAEQEAGAARGAQEADVMRLKPDPTLNPRGRRVFRVMDKKKAEEGGSYTLTQGWGQNRDVPVVQLGETRPVTIDSSGKEVIPPGVKVITDPGFLTRTIVQTPKTTLMGYGPLERSPAIFTKDRVPSSYETIYDISKDPRVLKFEGPVHTEKSPEIVHPELRSLVGILPDHHLFAFQQARMLPDLASHYSYLRAKNEYEKQPTHNSTPEGGFERIPESERIPAPTEEKRLRGARDYSRSLGRALLIAAPGIDISTPEGVEKALQSVKFSQERRRRELEDIRDQSMQNKNRRIQAKKENIMQWNNRYATEKTAFDPQSILHGLQAIPHGVEHVVRTVTNDMANLLNPEPAQQSTQGLTGTMYEQAQDANRNQFYHQLTNDLIGAGGWGAVGVGTKKLIDKARNVLDDKKYGPDGPVYNQDNPKPYEKWHKRQERRNK